MGALMVTLAAHAQAQAGFSVHGYPALDPLPHELHPQEWPQPDYFSEALKLTRFQSGQRWRALKLLGGHEPGLLVMPVQMQVFGWSPAFWALVGARLDRELEQRHVDANRQTDLFDADGPYARRFTDAETAAFAQAHPKAATLALYIGRDGEGKDFVTLTLRRDGRLLRAHRSFAEIGEVGAALAAFGANLAAMLDDLGLKAAPVAVAAPLRSHCEAGDWALADLKPEASPADRACRAIVIGTLLPEFDAPVMYYQRLKTADKLPWLAEAWVEADGLAAGPAKALRAVAWSQMELSPSYDIVSAVTDSPDPVARALARGLWARSRTEAMPLAARAEAEDEYANAAAANLPSFVRAALLERAMIDKPFRRVRLCSLEAELPTMKMPAGCEDSTRTTRTRAMTRGEHALLDAWRLAAAFKELHIEGQQRGAPASRQAVLDSMPARIAAHPLIGVERFASEGFEKATGSYETLVARARSATAEVVQTTADLQRHSAEAVNNAVAYERWTTNGALLRDPTIAATEQDDLRMMTVLGMDGFISQAYPLTMRATAGYMNLLSPGRLVDLRTVHKPFPPGASGGGAPRPPSRYRVVTGDPFSGAFNVPGEADDKYIANQAANFPTDLDALSNLATLHLKAGDSVAQARALVDARRVDARPDAAISESHAWVRPAHMFYYAGEFDAATFYYKRAVGFGSYSSSDLQARARLRLIAGDIPGALVASQERLQRYGDDFARRDVASLEFMSGRPALAWAVLTPRLPLSDQSELWLAAEVGQRIEGKGARAAHDWIEKSSFAHAIAGNAEIQDLYLLRLMTDDRVPSADDIALLAERRAQGDPSRIGSIGDLQAQALLKQLAVAPKVSPADLAAVLALLSPQGSEWRTRVVLKPLYAWAAWRASGGSGSPVAMFRDVPASADFDEQVAKAAVLGLDGRHDEALRSLRAARFALADTTGDPHRDARSAPYTVAYMAWLLYDKSKEPRYRDEALRLASAYQRISPFLAWPYALEALLLHDGKERTTAGCRAAFLDRDSLFLSLSGLKPDVHGANCRKSLW